MARPPKVRSYAAVLDRIRAARKADRSWSISTVARLSVPPDLHPIVCLRRRGSRGAPRLAFFAGTHGDEPAGVEAILRFLESGLPDRHPSLDLFVLPCQNPFGYVHDIRHSADGLDLNRQFDKPDTPAREVDGLRAFLLRGVPDVVVDCHEDPGVDGFYLWEIRRRGRPDLGRFLVDRVGVSYPVARAVAIEGCPAAGGVVKLTAGRVARVGGWSLTYFLYRNGASHCLTFETPVRLPPETRASIHLAAIGEVLAWASGARSMRF